MLGFSFALRSHRSLLVFSALQEVAVRLVFGEIRLLLFRDVAVG